MDFGLFEPLGVSLGLGLLVGLQRQWKESEIAGIRTFPLVSVLGTLTALLSSDAAGWTIGFGFIAIALLLLIANLAKIKAGHFDPGLTTEAAALVMYAVGGILGRGHIAEGIAVGGVVAVLLHWKDALHGFVKRIGEKDVRAVMHLVLIALVILPVLPNEAYDVYGVINPYKIWLVVVLIVSISLTAYVAYIYFGPRAGSVLGGILGGLISSTATTVSYARQAHGHPYAAGVSALVILVASTIVNVRVMFEIAVVAPGLLPAAGPPLAVMLAVMATLAFVLWLMVDNSEGKNPLHDNPAQLKAALAFAALYAVILFIVAAVESRFGDQALYAVAVISGLTDVDAITLSTAELAKNQQLDRSTAWRVILTATLSNLVFKWLAAGLLGGRRLFLFVSVVFGISIAVGIGLLSFWPV